VNRFRLTRRIGDDLRAAPHQLREESTGHAVTTRQHQPVLREPTCAIAQWCSCVLMPMKECSPGVTPERWMGRGASIGLAGGDGGVECRSPSTEKEGPWPRCRFSRAMAGSRFARIQPLGDIPVVCGTEALRTRSISAFLARPAAPGSRHIGSAKWS
jgi:hypothetical protein